MRLFCRPTLFFALLFVLFAAAPQSFTQPTPPDPEWKKDVEKMLTEFMSCSSPIDDISPCNVFLVRALNRVYGVRDFEKPGAPGGAMTANEIANFVESSTDKWTLLGKAGDQKTLNQAQGYTNLKKAVIAVLRGNPHGHVALIIPGEQTFSGNWQLNVPNSASFFLNKPEKSYVGKGLSFAFSSPADVKIYGRNF
jgi:hypothetical protein